MKIMKTRNLLMIALLAMSVSVLAGNEPKVVVVSQKSGLYKVIYEGAKAGKVTMAITDNHGTVIFKETVKTVNGFSRPVNFSGMELGVYTITITDETGKQIQSIDYQNDAVIKNVRVAKISEEGKYLLAVADNGPDQINVRIFDGENNLVHTENLTVKGTFGVVYNLKQVAGTPTFQVTDNTGNNLLIK